MTARVRRSAPKLVTLCYVGRPTPWIVPGFALKAVLGEFATEGILVGQRAVPRALERAGFTFRYETLDDALAAVR